MPAAETGLTVLVWKQWVLQVLVLLSFTFQIMLLVLAELRRRMDSGVLKAFVWSAYQLADPTAIYVLGHLSITSRLPEHELMAFWAPFLLLHLGGQDNITAYAIEDNQLWLRHLQTFAVQVAAAGYVLHESSIFKGGSPSLLRSATIFMCVVGVVKYGERVWALKCASSSSSGKNYRSFERRTASSRGPSTSLQDTEGFLFIAHLLLDVPRDFLHGPLPYVDLYYDTNSELRGEDLYKVVEMQLYLMHDIFYTKAEVMHSWYGLCIRVISLAGTSVALWLFRHTVLSSINGYSALDVAVTYVLLVGALVLEITSASRAMFSSWTCALLLKWSFSAWGYEQRRIWNLVGRVLASVRRLVHAADWRRKYWSSSMGQHNLVQMCVRSRTSRRSKVARWMGVEDPWNVLAYSGSTPVSACIKQLLVKQVLLQSEDVPEESPYHIINSRGRAVLKRFGLHEYLSWAVDDIELGESILIWHIATNAFFSWCKGQERNDLADAVQALSNYMLFLLAARPYMLPSNNRSAYVEMCYGLTGLDYSSADDLASLLCCHGNALNTGSEIEFTYSTQRESRRRSFRDNKALKIGSRLAAKLVSMELEPPATAAMMQLIAQVWVEILCYTGHRCSAYSHAKQLSSGGELVTVAALLVEYVRRDIVKDRASRSTS